MTSQTLKSYLVSKGPNSALVRCALWLHAIRNGFRLSFEGGHISISKGNRLLVLGDVQFIQAPIMMECFNLFFDTIDSKVVKNYEVLDFSRPSQHRYKKSGVTFYFPSIPEDDVMDAYTHKYMPQPGDVIWDVGAHAGATTYFFAQMVGPNGRVYSFEPDHRNFEYLLGNIREHNLANVVPVRNAISGKTGNVLFNMDGTMCAGIHEYLVYSGTGQIISVPAVTIADACAQFGGVPNYIKMDIEGAEVAAIEGSAEFLRSHPIHFAVESYHRVNNELTCNALERLFPTLGYEVSSSGEFGQMFTWAGPGTML